MVKGCHVWARKNPPPIEPMIPSELPDYHWQKVSSNLFQLKGKMYLLVADYFSRFPEVIQLSTTTSSSVIQTMKAIFARHGIPEQVVMDNGPQYASREMKEFTSSYRLRIVQTVKRLLQDADDPFMALLNYRSTPFPWCGLSPSELLYGRHLRTTLPQLDTNTFEPHDHTVIETPENRKSTV